MSQAFYFILLLGVLIFVHELGHFLFAKLFKVKVLVFSLGFGPKLLSFKKGETEYRLSLLPLGGYVKMIGENPQDEVAPEDQGRSLADRPLWQRAIVFAAGPIFNLILPIPLYFIFFISQSTLLPAKAGSVIVGGPAYNALIQPGDEFVSINGVSTPHWEDLSRLLSSRAGKPTKMVIKRDNKKISLTLIPKSVTIPNKLNIGQTRGVIGVNANYLGTKIGIADKNSAAARGGLRTWDHIVGVIDPDKGKFIPVDRWVELEKLLWRDQTKPLTVLALRSKAIGTKFMDLKVQDPVKLVLPPPSFSSVANRIVGGVARSIKSASSALSGVFNWLAELGGAPPRSKSPKEAWRGFSEAMGKVREKTVRAIAEAVPGLGRTLGVLLGYDKESVPGLNQPGRGLFRVIEAPLLGLGSLIRKVFFSLRTELAWPAVYHFNRFLISTLARGLESSELYVHEVVKGTPAHTMGMKPGDRLISLQGEGLTTWFELDQARQQDSSPKKHLQFTIAFVQAGRLVEKRFKHLKEQKIDGFKNTYTKVTFGAYNRSHYVTEKEIPVDGRFGRAVRMAFVRTGKAIELLGVGLFRLIQGKISFKSVGGPIMIFDIAGKAADKGWESFIWIMAFLSINLGFLNLLPIPILDGGHLLFAVIEAIRRKPISPKAREIASLVGLALLVALMIFAFKNDIERYWNDWFH